MMSSRIAFLLLWLLSSSTALLLLGDGTPTPHVVCNEKEKTALLSFKQGLTWDPSNMLLSSWSALQQDCCTWTGVRCNNITGRVIHLYLSNPYNWWDDGYESYETHLLGGKISPYLVELESLSYLDLSGNNFSGSTIPSFFGSMPSLKYLNLSFALFEGLIPRQLGNLSSLRVLDLSDNDQLYVDDLSWIAGLHSLEYLNMSWVSLHRINWLQEVSMLPSLLQLNLRSCELDKMIPPLAHVNSTSLEVLDLSGNYFNWKILHLLVNHTRGLMSLDLSFNSLYGQIPSSISNLPLLRDLNLGFNPRIAGQIPDGLGQLNHLESLYLNGNSLHGPIPSFIGNLSSLRELYLPDNQLNGTIPTSMGFLSNLEELSVDHNSLGGIVSEINFAKLSKLKFLDMSSNSIFFNVSSNWVPPFQLHRLRLSSCKMGPRFPTWLQTQTSLFFLDISQSGISGTAPEWFWKWVSGIESINLSGNLLNGDISNTLLNSTVVEMASNRFEGQLPRLSPNVRMLNLANNSFFGSISPFLCQEMNGESMLQVLDLANNILSGEVSHCLMNWQNMESVNMGSNHLSGKIPNSVGSLRFLTYLQLHNNTFLGEIPLSLRNCTHLSLINLGENEFTGLIPSWIGEMLNLGILCLQSNKFIGSIPSKICQLSNLIILDLGNNSLSGPIPKCLKNIRSMITTDSSNPYLFEVIVTYENYYARFYNNILSLVTKGRELKYEAILGLVRSIDLSSNYLSGSIPYELFSLHALKFLNLSHNQITGKIPENIGGMTMLESFDISRNHLLGEIPQSTSNLTFLSYLDLSYNNFSGRIPSGTQLQSFNATSYIGNVELCGAPLNNNCTREEESQGQGVITMEKEEEEYEMVWFYIGMGPGFVVGFWVVCGTLILKRTWRHAYFQLLDNVKDWIYLAILLKVNWLRSKFNRSNYA